MKKITSHLLTAAVLLFGEPAAAASVSYSTSSEHAYAIGDQIGSQYDQLLVNGYTGTATAMSTQPFSVDFANLEFVVGDNEYNPQNTAVPGSLGFSVTVNGQTLKDTLAYSWVSPTPGTVDYLSFATPQALTFSNAQTTVNVQFNQLAALSSSGAPVSEDLYGTVSITSNTANAAPISFQVSTSASSANVPEPASLGLLAIGMVGLGATRKKEKEKEAA